MQITYDPNLYECQDGRYLARFIGVEPFENSKALGRDGKPMPPGLKWSFVIAEGPDKDKTVSKITPRFPTMKNGCGRMIMGITDNTLDEEKPFDSANYVNLFYLVTIHDGGLSDTPAPRFVGGSEKAVSTYLATSPHQQVSKPKDSGPVPF